MSTNENNPESERTASEGQGNRIPSPWPVTKARAVRFSSSVAKQAKPRQSFIKSENDTGVWNGRALNRRHWLTGAVSLAGLALAGCVTKAPDPEKQSVPESDLSHALMYGPKPGKRFPVPAVDLKRVPAKFYRRQVDYPTSERVGTIIIDTDRFFLYLVLAGGKALRYGVGLGRAGFDWSGRARVGWKQEWPKWTPPDEMIARQPELAKWSARNGGMPPGLDNPLGARALYIFQGNVDTLYRIHGSPEYWTIGKAVSSGCVRMMNQDVIDLYGRVPAGSPIVVGTQAIA